MKFVQGRGLRGCARGSSAIEWLNACGALLLCAGVVVTALTDDVETATRNLFCRVRNFGNFEHACTAVDGDHHTELVDHAHGALPSLEQSQFASLETTTRNSRNESTVDKSMTLALGAATVTAGTATLFPEVAGPGVQVAHWLAQAGSAIGAVTRFVATKGVGLIPGLAIPDSFSIFGPYETHDGIRTLYDRGGGSILLTHPDGNQTTAYLQDNERFVTPDGQVVAEYNRLTDGPEFASLHDFAFPIEHVRPRPDDEVFDPAAANEVRERDEGLYLPDWLNNDEQLTAHEGPSYVDQGLTTPPTWPLTPDDLPETSAESLVSLSEGSPTLEDIARAPRTQPDDPENDFWRELGIDRNDGHLRIEIATLDGRQYFLKVTRSRQLTGPAKREAEAGASLSEDELGPHYYGDFKSDDGYVTLAYDFAQGRPVKSVELPTLPESRLLLFQLQQITEWAERNGYDVDDLSFQYDDDTAKLWVVDTENYERAAAGAADTAQIDSTMRDIASRVARRDLFARGIAPDDVNRVVDWLAQQPTDQLEASLEEMDGYGDNSLVAFVADPAGFTARPEPEAAAHVIERAPEPSVPAQSRTTSTENGARLTDSQGRLVAQASMLMDQETRNAHLEIVVERGYGVDAAARVASSIDPTVLTQAETISVPLTGVAQDEFARLFRANNSAGAEAALSAATNEHPVTQALSAYGLRPEPIAWGRNGEAILRFTWER